MPQTNSLRRGKKKKSTKFIDKKVSIRDMAKGVSSLWNQVLEIKGIINAEKKYFQTQAASSYDYNGSIQYLTLIPGGSAESQRNGNSCYVKGVSLRGYAVKHTSATDTVLRIMVCIDKSPNPTGLAASDVLNVTGSTYAPFSGINNDNKTRFKVLTTKLVTLNSGETSSPFKAYLPLKHHCKWNSSTASDINKGHIFLLIISQEATNTPSVQYRSTVSYYDN